MCNPIKVFETTIKDIDGDAPTISIDHYVEPHADRSRIVSESMPIDILSKQEQECLASAGVDVSSAVSVNEEQRRYLPIRFGKAISHEQKYQRKSFLASSKRK